MGPSPVCLTNKQFKIEDHAVQVRLETFRETASRGTAKTLQVSFHSEILLISFPVRPASRSIFRLLAISAIFANVRGSFGIDFAMIWDRKAKQRRVSAAVCAESGCIVSNDHIGRYKDVDGKRGQCTDMFGVIRFHIYRWKRFVRV